MVNHFKQESIFEIDLSLQVTFLHLFWYHDMFISSVQSCRNNEVNRQHVFAWFHFIFLRTSLQSMSLALKNIALLVRSPNFFIKDVKRLWSLVWRQEVLADKGGWSRDSDTGWLQRTSQDAQVLGGCVRSHQFLVYCHNNYYYFSSFFWRLLKAITNVD